MKKGMLITILSLTTIGVLFRLFCGVFVIQPIGAIPDGLTIIYWRGNINLPFVTSADGILDKSGEGVSILGRGLLIAKLVEPIKEREIYRFGYSETMYLWSTNGKQYKQ